LYEYDFTTFALLLPLRARNQLKLSKLTANTHISNTTHEQHKPITTFIKTEGPPADVDADGDDAAVDTIILFFFSGFIFFFDMN
jgi:hypothetical protein